MPAADLQAAPGSDAVDIGTAGEIPGVGPHRFVLELVPAGTGQETAVSVRASGVGGGAVPETSPDAVLLRNALIGHADLVRDRVRGQPGAPGADAERHLLRYLPPGASEEQRKAALENVRLRLPGLLAPAAEVAAGGRKVPEDWVNLLWWDERPNFGDAVGPWLVRRLTGSTPVNGWRRNLDVPPLVTAGSTAGWLEQDGTQIWGAGLMAPLEPGAAERLSQLRGVRIHAVRGALTGAQLRSRLGWNVPETYGDPALLLPRFLPVPDGQPSQGKVAVLPHLDHRGIFGDPESYADSGADRVHVVDARQGMEQVVREIAGSRACISSSLHGIIVAQAYGVPWVWLRIDDAAIAGGTFKFRDLFTTLDASAVSAVGMTAAQARRLNPVVLARKAALPRLEISLEALLDAFPLPLKG